MSEKRSQQNEGEKQQRLQRFTDWLNNDPVRVYSSWSVEQAATLPPKSLGKTRAAHAPFSRLDAFRTSAQKSPRFSEGHRAVDDIREALQTGDTKSFFLAVRLYRFDALRILLQDPGIYEIVQGWGDASERGEQLATARLARVGEELAYASYRRRPRPDDKRPLSNKEAVSITKLVQRLRKHYEKRREAGQDAKEAYTGVLKEFSDNSRAKDMRRKRLALERFNEEVVKIDPSLKDLVSRKIWLRK